MRLPVSLAFFAGLLLISACGQAVPQPFIRVNGEVQPAAVLEVKTPAGGRIKKLHVRMGDQVKSGDLLVEIQVPLEEDKPSEIKVLAPRAGTIFQMPVIEGQRVAPAIDVSTGTTLMIIADLSSLMVEAHVDPATAARLAPKQIVTLRAAGIADKPMEATVTFIAPIATLQASLEGVTVRALLQKPNARLRPGMAVELSLPAAASLKP